MCEPPKSSCTDITGATRVDEFHLKYEWKIFNFSLLRKKTGECLNSAIFSPAEDVNIKWSLKIYPNGYNDKDFISLFLEFHPTESRKDIDSKFDLRIIGKEGDISKSYLLHHFQGEGDNLGNYRFMAKNDLLDDGKFLQNDCLTIDCNITGYLGIFTLPNQPTNSYTNIEAPSNCNLKFAYETLFKNQELTDIVLKASGQALHAHKAILAAHSPVFLAMFKEDMKEKLTNQVDIPDVQFNVLQEALRFIYCGTIENIEDNVNNLLIVSDKYDIASLKFECEKYLSKNLKIANVVDALSVADMYNATNLRKCAIEFFLIHKKEVIGTENFKAFGELQPQTIEEITKGLVNSSY